MVHLKNSSEQNESKFAFFLNCAIASDIMMISTKLDIGCDTIFSGITIQLSLVNTYGRPSCTKNLFHEQLFFWSQFFC